MSIELTLLLVVLSLALAAYFSGIEAGFYALNKTRLLLNVRAGRLHAAAVQACLRDAERTIATALIGNNLVHYAATALCAAVWEDHVRVNPHLGNLLVLTPIVFLFCEVIPKNLFAIHADRLTYGSVRLFQVFRVLFYPLALALSFASRIMGREAASPLKTVPRTRSLIRVIIEESRERGVLSPQQMQMAMNTMAISEVPVTDVMIPLARAEMISRGASIEDLLEVCKKTRFSELPVYEGSRKNIVGIVRVLDYFCTGSERPLQDLMRPVEFVNTRAKLFEALRQLQRKRQRMGVVVNDRGEALGIVTVKDIAEEIVGELHER